MDIQWLCMLLAQVEAGGGAAPAAPAADGGGGFGAISIWPFVLAMGVAFYFLMLRPDRQKKAEMAQRMESLKKNDRIVTIGGIYGTVVNSAKGSDEVTIRIDEGNNTRMRIMRSAIRDIIDDDKSKGDAKDRVAEEPMLDGK